MNTLNTKHNLNNEPQWYIVTVVSGNEDSVIKNLRGKIEAYGLSDLIQDIKVIKDSVIKEEIFTEDDLPTNYGKKLKDVTWETFKDANNKTKYKKIKKVDVNRYFGYIFIKMIMTDEAWFAIRNTQLITGIIGSSGRNTKPTPVGDDEIAKILEANENEQSAKEILNATGKVIETEGDTILVKDRIKHNFSIDQTVRITSGQFENEKGNISHINDLKGKLLVRINLFGRDTEVELGFDNVELDI